MAKTRVKTDKNGVKIYLRQGVYHRLDGPAFIGPDTEKWYKYGKLHRVGGPAITKTSIHYRAGCTEWYIDGKLHREDGPALVYADGGEYWYTRGKITRIGGPAITNTKDRSFFWRDSVGNAYWIGGQYKSIDKAITDSNTIMVFAPRLWVVDNKVCLSAVEYQTAAKLSDEEMMAILLTQPF